MCDDSKLILIHGWSPEAVKLMAEEVTNRKVRNVTPVQIVSSATGTQAPLPFMDLSDPNLTKDSNEAFFGTVRAYVGFGSAIGSEREWVGSIVVNDDYVDKRPPTALFQVWSNNGANWEEQGYKTDPVFFYKVAQITGLNVMWSFTGYRIRFTT